MTLRREDGTLSWKTFQKINPMTMNAKIICITGDNKASENLAVYLHVLYTSPKERAVILNVGDRPTVIKAMAAVERVVEKEKSPKVIILTGFPSSVKNVEEFFTLSKRTTRLPQELFFINIAKDAAQLKNKASIAADYMGNLLRDSKGASGTILSNGNIHKLVIDALSLMAHFDQKVTVCGTAVSGKTTITKGIEKELGYQIFSAGNEITRVFAERKNMELDEVVQRIKWDKQMAHEYDTTADDWNKKIITGKTHFALECRLGAMLAADTKTKTFNVLLQIDDKTAGIRLYNDIVNNPNSRRKQLAYTNVQDATIGTAERNQLDRQRYIETYDGFDFTDTKHYHCVIDSVAVPKDEMVNVFMNNYTSFLMKEIG